MITLAEILATGIDPVTRDDAAIAAVLSLGRVKIGSISRAEFAMWAAANGMRGKIEDHAANPASPLRSVALACRDVIQGAADGIALDLAANQAMLGAWVAIGELSQTEHDKLIDLATRVDPVSVGEVSDFLNAAGY